MSSTETFGLELLLAPLAILVLIAAGVAVAVARGAVAAGELLAAAELERRLRERAHGNLQRALEAHRHRLLSDGHVDACVEALCRARAIHQALEAEPTLRLVAERWHHSTLSQALRAMHQAETSAGRGTAQDALRLARRAEELMTTATYDSFRRLEAAQQQVIADATAASMGALGYTLQRASRGGAVALWGRAGDRTLVAVIAGGRLQTDMAGFDGIRCCEESERLVAEMRSRGLEVRRVARTLHARREGGTLIAQALGQVRTSGLSPAEALVRVATPNLTRKSAGHGAVTTRSTPSHLDRARAWMWLQHSAVTQLR
jgi:hypothetical protein